VSEPALSVLLCTEDSGGQAHATLAALVGAMLRLVDSECDADLIAILPADEEARLALGGRKARAWTAEGHRNRLRLAAKIADQVARDQPDGFVAFHFDGDRPWSKEPGDLRDYEKIRRIVIDRLAEPRRGDRTYPPERIERLLLVAPYWSIEAWLYQNTPVAKRICVREHPRGRHRNQFASWEHDRASLDEVEKPKERCCLGAKHNQELAETSFPARAVHEAGASFAATVERFRACAPLREALARARTSS
jgi:hypothetical protein